MEVKTLDLNGITYIEPVTGGAPDWYWGESFEHGDLYEAEEVFRAGGTVEGRHLCIIHYPDGAVYWPVPKQPGTYPDNPVYWNGDIYLLNVIFPEDKLQILRFRCDTRTTELFKEFPLSLAKDCYNLRLDPDPLTITRQRCGTNEFEILWPEQVAFYMQDTESFFLREGDRLYFSCWYEDPDYRDTVNVRNLQGELLEQLDGDLRVMPNGEVWWLR
ncbi:MAG: hypothetical protein IJH91_02605 [Mogibacterium sp.]|nr:hypothetical protein [Mogibacterium sp.]